MEIYSNLLSFLASVSVRSLVLAMLAAAVMAVFRVRAAAVRHAVWTMVTMGMLLLAAFAPLMPPIPLRVFRPVPAANVDAASTSIGPIHASPVVQVESVPSKSTPSARSIWPQVAAALYAAGSIFLLARLGLGYLFTLRLVRASRPLEHAWAPGIFQSSWIAVPLTVGWIHPKILLPSGWETWGHVKLQAVLAHERTHIQRRDWAISMLAGWNRCLFWFNPLAWWLERALASLAEQACDDSALLVVTSEHYAQALLDMAAAVKSGQGRLVWEAMAMAKAAEVKKRIERILDDTRQIPRGLTRSRWVMLVACSVPLIYVASAVRLVAQQPNTPAAMSDYLKGKRQLSSADISTMEQYLLTNPHDLDVRSQVILYYYANGVRDKRLGHILWLVANHPESDAAVFASMGVSPRPNQVSDPADYARLQTVWRQQAAAHPNDVRILGNAAQFFAQPGGDFPEAERLLLRARSIENGNVHWIERLADLYAKTILGATGDPHFGSVDANFAARVRSQLEISTEFPLVQMTAIRLAGAAMRAPVTGGALNLDDHPLLLPAVDFGGRLMARVREQAPATQAAPQSSSSAGFLSVTKVDPVYPPLARQARIQGDVQIRGAFGPDGHVTSVQVVSGHPLLAQAAADAVKQWFFPGKEAGNFAATVPFRLDGSGSPAISQAQFARPLAPGTALQAGQALSPEGPPPVSQVDPVYPPLARQARIQGDVRLQASAGADGHPTHLEVISGHPLLIGAALEAVKQWVFPAGTPPRFLITVPFRLNGASASLGQSQVPPGGYPVPGGVVGGVMDGVVGGIPKGSRGGVVGGVPGGIAGGVPGADFARPVRVRIGSKVQESRLIRKVDPEYPAQARAAGISGNVTLEVTIGEDGHVESVKPLDGHPLLAAAAQDAVKQWLYQPTMLNQQPVTVLSTVSLSFDPNQ